ncbi:MAG TPA: adenylate/guanylate cyclase domain-containing protein [Candidatus Binataceae bacterium]|nr:adenylate/guanylate cyclase domain-containing protein [Candidatus Binataceae bacterium]
MPAPASAKKSNDAPIRVTDSPAADSLEGERKIVTALFADLKGSTELLETLDPEEGRAIVEPLLRIMSEAVRRYEGYLVRTTGDGIFALFGAPVAYEDHPQRALYAALYLQQELRAYGRERATKRLPVLQARVGVHTGEVVAYTGVASGNLEYRLIGHTANLASRIEGIAPVGSIATSEDTRRLCEGYFELRDLGPVTIKGVSARIKVYEIIGLGPLRSHFEVSARRGLTRFVGREDELEQMRRAREQAQSGRGQIVAVVAEAGTGKSRLFYEFKAAIPGDCKILEAYSVSHGKASAWLPVLELLRSYFGLIEHDDAGARRSKIQNKLKELDPTLTETLPYLFGLLGLIEGPDPHAQMDPQIKRQHTLDTIKRILLCESLNQPLVVIFEDLHWIDEQTQALLDLIADSIATARVLLLVNYRPECRHVWGNKSYYSQLALTALDQAGTVSMLTALLGEAVELNPLKRLIVERTGGNPFFIEEIVQALFEDGALIRNGIVKVTRSLSQLRLPTTVQGMLASRIGTLSGEHKQLLETLAVIGREAPLKLLREVAAIPEAQLSDSLRGLRAGEFIYEQPAVGETEYVFKHALTQEVAYASLLIERRRLIHQGVGDAIEMLFAHRLADYLSELAHHYSRSADTVKALNYLQRAGEHCAARSANGEALMHFNIALKLLKTLPDSAERMERELDIEARLGPILLALRGYGSADAEKVYVRARELCAKLGEPTPLFPVLWGLWIIHMSRGEDHMKARRLGNELLALAKRLQDPAQLLQAHHALWTTFVFGGDFVTAVAHADEGKALYRPELHHRDAALYGAHDAGVCSDVLAATALWLIGYPERALQRTVQAQALALQLGHLNSIVFSLMYPSLVHLLRRDTRAAAETAEAGIRLATENGLVFGIAIGNFILSWTRTALECRRDDVAQMRRSLVDVLANWRSPFQGLLAERLGAMGEFVAGLELVDEALSFAKTGWRWYYEADLHRIKGELLLLQDKQDGAKAEECLIVAISVARRQNAKSLELRATMGLARLLASQGRRDEARTRLAEIYNWFTEGFDTLDLIEAKALLDELSA